MARSVLFLLAATAFVVASACSSAPPPAQPTAAGKSEPAPTAAPEVEPTATAQPRPTAAPTALPAKQGLLISSTIGPIDAGIIGALEDAYLAKTGVRIRHVGAGTGATLDQAKGGAFDLVIVHARSLEDKFIADGFGIDRRDIMYNDFVILGPASDPAGIKGEKKATDAFARMAAAKALTVTRGDNSGTDVKEKEIWAKVGIKPEGDWYVKYERGSEGNAPTTRYADQRGAYVLMDRATYITLRKDIKLQVLVEKDEDLLNFIAAIKINPAKFPKINAQGAKEFVDWLVGDEAQTLIKDFGVKEYGQPLFFPNSDEWKKAHP